MCYQLKFCINCKNINLTKIAFDCVAPWSFVNKKLMNYCYSSVSGILLWHQFVSKDMFCFLLWDQCLFSSLRLKRHQTLKKACSRVMYKKQHETKKKVKSTYSTETTHKAQHKLFHSGTKQWIIQRQLLRERAPSWKSQGKYVIKAFRKLGCLKICLDTGNLLCPRHNYTNCSTSR